MKLKLSKDSYSGLFCATTVLKSFGIEAPNRPMMDYEIFYALKSANLVKEGSKMAWVIEDARTGTKMFDRDYTKRNPTLSKFIEYMADNGYVEKYDIVFYSRGHAMAIKDGELIDTAKMHGRTRVTQYMLIERN